MSTRKVWPSLSQYLWNSKMLNSIMFRTLIPNFTQIRQ